MDKLESIREEDYGQCDSPKAKKVFINMLDSHMHSPMHSKQPKMKSVDGKSINLSSPSSYTSSSPSSTSSLSSTSNIHHQKQAMANQAINGSSEYISKENIKLGAIVSLKFKFYSARYSQHAKLQPPSANATTWSWNAKSHTPLNAFELGRHEWRRLVTFDVDGTSDWTWTASVTTNAATHTCKRPVRARNSRCTSFDSNTSR